MMHLKFKKASIRARLLFIFCRLFLWLGLAAITPPESLLCAANPPRFVARFANGTIAEGNTLADWHTAEAIPKLEAHPLFDANNPVRWILDRTLFPAPSLPEAFIEMSTGDRLPGVVVDYRAGDASPYSPMPTHFLVRFEGRNPSSLEPQSAIVRVDANAVRRIVWNGRRPASAPRTVYLRDGSFLRYRSIRWSTGFMSLLLESGQRRVAWADVAEVQLAPRDFWPDYFDELARLVPDGQRRLLQLENVDGLVVTTSLDRMLPRYVGDAKDVNRWLLGVQPAWSFDVLWLGQGSIWARRSFAPHEVPLTRMTPTRVEQNSLIGAAKFPVGINRNLNSGSLRSRNREAGWGFGVQALSELEFELPPGVRSLRSDFAIDAAMKLGGCVQPRVLNAAAGNAVLYQGPIVVGSESVVETGIVAIPGGGESPRRITLHVDPVLTNRPENADPLTIRDQANWLDPTVELDPGVLKQQLDSRLQRQMASWNNWTLQIEPGGQVLRTNFFAEAAGSGEFVSALSVTGKELRLTKNHPLTKQDQWFVIDAVRTQPAGPPCKLAVKVGDGMPVEWDVPAYDKNRSDFRPLILSLADFHRKNASTVTVEVRQLPGTEAVPVLWRAMTFVNQHPLYYRLVEDTLVASREASSDLPGGGAYDDQQKFSGLKAVRLPVPSTFKIPMGQTLSIRERPQLGEYRFLRFAVRKQGGGGIRVAVLHAASAERPAGYEGGKDVVGQPGWKRLTNQAWPADWQVVTRDLFADFGNLDITDLAFEFADGEQVWLDHVYLARTQNDFELIKATLPQAR